MTNLSLTILTKIALESIRIRGLKEIKVIKKNQLSIKTFDSKYTITVRESK